MWPRLRSAALRQGFSHFIRHQTQTTGPTSRVSDPMSVGWGPRICFSYKSPGEAGAAGLGATASRTTAVHGGDACAKKNQHQACDFH